MQKADSKNADVLFVSHILNPEHAGLDQDFYFGELPTELSKVGLTSAIMMLNHTGEDSAGLERKWQGAEVPRYVLRESLPWKDEASFRRRLKRERKKLLAFGKLQTDPLGRAITFYAAGKAASIESLFNLRLAAQVESVVKLVKPRAVITTYEGHAWERLVYSSARQAASDICCIGYQHAALFKLQHAARRNLASRFNPDQILTSGVVSKEQLENTPGLDGIPISVLGSSRVSPAIKRTPTCRGKMKDSTARTIYECLVLPEGIDSECNLLFEFSRECAVAMQNVHFTWRLHPVIRFESLVDKNRKLLNLPENINISAKSLQEDVERCDLALYRGSTAIINAVIAGARPVYLKQKKELSVDPLYALDRWKLCIESVADFKRVVSAAERQPADIGDIRVAQKYCRAFFSPFDMGTLLKAIPSES